MSTKSTPISDTHFLRGLQLARFRLDCVNVVMANGSMDQKNNFASAADSVYNWCKKDLRDFKIKK